MSSVERLARVLRPGAWPEKVTRGGKRHFQEAQEEAINQAEAMLTHPDLLPALAAAGLLRAIERPYNDGGPLAAVAGWERYYVTDWAYQRHDQELQ